MFNKGIIRSDSDQSDIARQEYEESIAEGTKQKSKKKSDQLSPNWVKVSEEKFNLIKQIFNENKSLGTTINNKRYTLNDANDLVNKIAQKKIGKNNAIKFYNKLVEKAKQISELRSTPPRQQMLEIFNYLGEIFNEPKTDDEQPDTTNMPKLESEECAAQRRNQQGKGLKILTPNHMLNRFAISLGRLKAGNNSEKLKNEIRKILYSLYRSTKLTKQIYKSLINII